LPHETVRIAYSLEYGIDEMEMHRDAVKRGQKVILVDDLVATGGTAEGAVKLLQRLGADVVAACFVIDLPDLGGRARIEALGVPVRTLVEFSGHLSIFAFHESLRFSSFLFKHVIFSQNRYPLLGDMLLSSEPQEGRETISIPIT
jgi:adenine phosphoribosyltransferase